MRQLKVALFIGIALLTACNAPQSDMKKTSAPDREAQPQSQAAPPTPTPAPMATPAPAPPAAAPAPDRARPPEVSEAAPGAYPHRHLDKRRVAARRVAPTA